jgi:polyribonucleotide nucleotidyltransferase
MDLAALCNSSPQKVLPTAPTSTQENLEPVDAIKAKRPRSNDAEMLKRYEEEHTLLIAVNKEAMNHKQTTSHDKKIEKVATKIKALKKKASLNEEKQAKVAKTFCEEFLDFPSLINGDIARRIASNISRDTLNAARNFSGLALRIYNWITDSY